MFRSCVNYMKSSCIAPHRAALHRSLDWGEYNGYMDEHLGVLHGAHSGHQSPGMWESMRAAFRSGDHHIPHMHTGPVACSQQRAVILGRPSIPATLAKPCRPWLPQLSAPTCWAGMRGHLESRAGPFITRRRNQFDTYVAAESVEYLYSCHGAGLRDEGCLEPSRCFLRLWRCSASCRLTRWLSSHT